MEPAHGNKRVPIRYTSWLALADSSAPANGDPDTSNLFLESRLAVNECTSQAVPWIAESGYRVPMGHRDGVPLTGETRQFSEAQESAQLLGGTGATRPLLMSVRQRAPTQTQIHMQSSCRELTAPAHKHTHSGGGEHDDAHLHTHTHTNTRRQTTNRDTHTHMSMCVRDTSGAH